MPSYMEFEGKKVDMAIDKACKKLGVKKEELKHEIISYGSTGIFGLVGTKKARIRVSMADEKIQKNEKDPIKEKRKEPEIEEKAEEGTVSIDLTACADLGKDVIEKILLAVSPEATVSVKSENEKILYKLKGGNAGVLIGKRGQTLDAIQYVVEKIVNKRSTERLRIQIDVEGYLENRKDSLRLLAGKLAEKAKRTGKPVTVGHMAANDRRVVHLALKKDKNVRTQSLGEGFVKKLVIFPKRKPHQSNRKKDVVKDTNDNGKTSISNPKN